MAKKLTLANLRNIGFADVEGYRVEYAIRDPVHGYELAFLCNDLTKWFYMDRPIRTPQGIDEVKQLLRLLGIQ